MRYSLLELQLKEENARLRMELDRLKGDKLQLSYLALQTDPSVITTEEFPLYAAVTGYKRVVPATGVHDLTMIVEGQTHDTYQVGMFIHSELTVGTEAKLGIYDKLFRRAAQFLINSLDK